MPKRGPAKRAHAALTKTRKKLEVDWSDEDSVAAALAADLGVEDPADLRLKEDRGLSSFGTATIYEFRHDGGEWAAAENQEAADELAVAVVKQDLEHEPEIFNQSFIERHIDKERLRNDLLSDVENMRQEDLEDEAQRRPIEFMKEHGIDIPMPSDRLMQEHASSMGDTPEEEKEIYAKLKEMDPEDAWIEMGDEPEVPSGKIEDVAREQAEEQLKDPVAYLEDLYGPEEAVKKAIELAGIDVDSAAADAVEEDGAEHFLARYDGTIHDGPNHIVYWRTN